MRIVALFILFTTCSSLWAESDIEDNIFLDEALETDSLDDFTFDEEIDFSEDSLEERNVDWKLDISASGVVPIYSLEESALKLESSSNSSFAFDLGLNLLFLKKHLFTSVSARYLNLSFDVNRVESSSNEQVAGTTISDIYATEELHYFSVPVTVGGRLELGAFTPYLFFELEPAILTAAALHSRVSQTSKFENGATLSKEYVSDQNVKEYREDKQLFYGFGGGVEFNYGYGIVYLESAYKMTYFDHDTETDPITIPVRGVSELSYIPITLGLRFYF